MGTTSELAHQIVLWVACIHKCYLQSYYCPGRLQQLSQSLMIPQAFNQPCAKRSVNAPPLCICWICSVATWVIKWLWLHEEQIKSRLCKLFYCSKQKRLLSSAFFLSTVICSLSLLVSDWDALSSLGTTFSSHLIWAASLVFASGG